MPFSNAVRVQLVQWLCANHFNYITQSVVLPKKTLRKIRSLSYQFIWSAQEEVRRKDSTFPKVEGDLGLRDYKQLHWVAATDHTKHLWTQPGIWAAWTEQRYQAKVPKWYQKEGRELRHLEILKSYYRKAYVLWHKQSFQMAWGGGLTRGSKISRKSLGYDRQVSPRHLQCYSQEGYGRRVSPRHLQCYGNSVDVVD